MTTLRLYLENISGEWFGWIENMPGCYCRGNTPEEARHSAARAAADYLHWLRRHGEPPPLELSSDRDTDFVIEIAETYSALLDDLQLEPTAFFSCDARPLERFELERTLRLMRHARADLTEAVTALPPNDWETAPLGERSIRAVLGHLGDVEREVLRVFGVEPTLRPDPDPLAFLNGLRSVLEAEIGIRLPLDDRKYAGISGEIWSLRKALRILLWHERYHTAQIAARSNPRAFLDELSHAVVMDRRGDRVSTPTERRSDYAEAARTSTRKEYFY